MQDFSEWMTTLQKQQHSSAYSYAETDMTDSDSDSDCQCHHREPKRKSVAKDADRVWTRTSPISIPSNSRVHPHPHLCESVTESPDLSYHADMRLLRAGRYLHEDEDDTLDEDDPTFYGNLAFFRSQYGASQTRMVKRSVHPIKSSSLAGSPTAVDERDEDIFDMEFPLNLALWKEIRLTKAPHCGPQASTVTASPSPSALWCEAARAWHAVGRRADSFYRGRRPRHHRRRFAARPCTRRGFGQSRQDSDFRPIVGDIHLLPRSFTQLRRPARARASIGRQLAERHSGCHSRQPDPHSRTATAAGAKGPQSAIVEALRTTLRQQAPLTSIQVEPNMPAQTQSLPTWASIQALPSVTKAGSPVFDDEDPLYLSGEETDCDSERGSDTLSREDQQLMANFIRLQRERKQVSHQATKLPAAPRTTPVLIPAQTRKYVATSTKRWIWDEDDEEYDECDQCPCCNHRSFEVRSTTAVEPVADVSAVSDLMFDLEL